MPREVGFHPGYYTGLGEAIGRLSSDIVNACAGAAGVVNAYFLHEKAHLYINDPEKYKKKYPAEFKD